jgi:hypothetical protein
MLGKAKHANTLCALAHWSLDCSRPRYVRSQSYAQICLKIALADSSEISALRQSSVIYSIISHPHTAVRSLEFLLGYKLIALSSV